METRTTRVTSQVARSRGTGAGVGTLMGVGWMAYGLSILPKATRWPLGLFGVLIVWYVLSRSHRLVVQSRNLPSLTTEQRASYQRAWRWFWLNFLGEIVLLNVAINLLTRPELRIYWIPAISLVVGLHFLPMARFFGVPSYWVCGGAMMGLAAIVTCLLWADALGAPSWLVATEALLNACILWATAAWGVHVTDSLLE